MGDTRFSPALPGRGIFYPHGAINASKSCCRPCRICGQARRQHRLQETRKLLSSDSHFFSSEKNVNRLRKNHMFRTNAYFIGYQQNNTILKKIRQYGLGNGACGRRKGEGDEGKATWGLTKSMPEKSSPKDTKLCRTQKKAHFPLTRKRKGRFLRQNPPSLSFPNPRPSFLKPHRFPF